MRKPSISDVLVELLREMGIPDDRISAHQADGVGSVDVALEGGRLKEVQVAGHDDIELPAYSGITIHIERNAQVKIFGMRGSKLSFHDPEFADRFQKSVISVIQKRANWEGLKEAKKALDEYLEIFLPIVEDS